jgi:hypothetical protein
MGSISFERPFHILPSDSRQMSCKVVQISQPDHDLIIKLDLCTTPESFISYNVSSAHIIAASSYFKALFTSHYSDGTEYSNHKYSKEKRPSLVNFSGDNPPVLDLLLRIMHNQHDNLPDVVSFDCLVSLTGLAEKYDVARVARIFVQYYWFPKCLTTVMTPESYLDAMYVAWVFKLEDIFERISFAVIIAMSKHSEKEVPNDFTFLRCSCEKHNSLQFFKYPLAISSPVVDKRIPDGILREFSI